MKWTSLPRKNRIKTAYKQYLGRSVRGGVLSSQVIKIIPWNPDSVCS